MNILLMICDNLMQKTVYEKYYRFFSGFLLVLCLLKPVIDIVGTESYFHVSFLQQEWKNEWSLLKNAKELDGVEEVVRQERETAYRTQIKEIANKYGMQVKEIIFRWDNEGEKLKKIKIDGSMSKEQSRKIKKILMQLYELEESDICIEVE